MTERALYSVDEATDQLSLSKSQMYELIRSGRLVTVKVGRRRLVPATAIAAYVEMLILESGGHHGRAA